jgi:hypothetical protein
MWKIFCQKNRQAKLECRDQTLWKERGWQCKPNHLNNFGCKVVWYSTMTFYVFDLHEGSFNIFRYIFNVFLHLRSCSHVLIYYFQINMDNAASLNVLHRLLESLAPIVFRPVDILLKTLLQTPHSLVMLEIILLF